MSNTSLNLSPKTKQLPITTNLSSDQNLKSFFLPNNNIPNNNTVTNLLVTTKYLSVTSPDDDDATKSKFFPGSTFDGEEDTNMDKIEMKNAENMDVNSVVNSNSNSNNSSIKSKVTINESDLSSFKKKTNKRIRGSTASFKDYDGDQLGTAENNKTKNTTICNQSFNKIKNKSSNVKNAKGFKGKERRFTVAYISGFNKALPDLRFAKKNTSEDIRLMSIF